MGTSGPTLRRMRDVLYRLKRAYGLPLTLVTTTGTSDVATGAATTTRSATVVRRAVVLPATIHKDFKFDIGYLRANSNFTYGSLYTEGTRQILIDRLDLPRDFTITVTDSQYVVFLHRRYAIKSVDQLEIPCYYLTVQETRGAPVSEVHVVEAFDRLAVLESFAGTINGGNP